MFDWNITRRVLIVLLLIPLLHFTVVVLRDVGQVLDPLPTVWESEVAAYERSDSTLDLPKKPLVVIGGRQARLWYSLDRVLFPMPVLNRGIGDANLDDLTHYIDRLVTPYQPMAVLYIPGATDFVLRDDKSATEFMQATASLCAEIYKLDSAPRCYVMSLPKWPAYPEAWERVDRANELLQLWTEASAGATFIDSRPILQQADGASIGTYFRNDGHNLNDWGMEKIAPRIQAALKADFPVYF